jgi:type IV pilus assembly protein PilA
MTKANNQTGFTLIELLVVVAIIGIIASIGVVAYSGYTSGAKQKVTQAQYTMTLKYAQAEALKCNWQTTAADGHLTCSKIHNTNELATAVRNAFDGELLNPYKSHKENTVAVNSIHAYGCGKDIYGQISINNNSSSFTISSCMGDGPNPVTQTVPVL